MKQAELSRRERQVYRNVELWKPIEGFPDYEISNMGRVKSLINDLILKPENITGYFKVNLSDSKTQTKHSIHSMVIEHFGDPKPTPKYECNHKDGDKSNNWDTNLEWMTKKENIKHAYATGLLNNTGANNGRAKLTEKEVNKIRRLYQTGKYYQRNLNQMFNVSVSLIGDIINFKIWKHI